MIGPVHEKETTTSVSAIKKMPANELMPAFLSALFAQEEGSVISNAPKKEAPNRTNTPKNTRLAIQLVARLFRAAGPKANVIKRPSKVTVSYTHLRAHETPEHLVCRLL